MLKGIMIGLCFIASFNKWEDEQIKLQPVIEKRHLIEEQYEDYKFTAYDLSIESCGKLDGITRSGYSVKGMSRTDAMVVAVDPKVIPLGTRLQIKLPEPYEYLNGTYTARDTGGAVKGKHIDIYFGDFGQRMEVAETRRFGMRRGKVRVLKGG